MQFIESSIIGVRSSVLTMGRRATPMRFVLFPMVHVGERAFYEEVSVRLRDCALIVAEGGPAGVGPMQERMARLRLDDLVDQVVALDLEALGVPVLWEYPRGRPPVSGRDRLRSTVEDSLSAVGLRLLGRHRDPLGAPGIDQAEAYDDRWERLEAGRRARVLQDRVIDRRDAALVKVLAGVHQQHSADAVDVAVVWGAAHMPAVVEYLGAGLRYHVKDAEWLTVRGAPS